MQPDEHDRERAARERRGIFASTAIALAALAAAAAYNARAVRRAEDDYPPAGRFVDVQGVRLHYIERGSGSPVVLLHGNGLSADDWETSGLLDTLAAGHRVIAFDRPGFGYSTRPRDMLWTPSQQAALLQDAWTKLEVRRPVVVAHSWATMVALALALDFPADVERLVLLGGYYFPTLRLDAPVFGAPGVPVVGNIIAATVAPLVSRLLWPLIARTLFAPALVAERFARFPVPLIFRPSQLFAAGQESLTMAATAAMLEPRYLTLTTPVTVVTGTDDRVVDPAGQSERLAQLVTGASARHVEGAGHMVHYAAPGVIVEAVNAVDATLAGEASG